jgi:hypothetical protein
MDDGRKGKDAMTQPTVTLGVTILTSGRPFPVAGDPFVGRATRAERPRTHLLPHAITCSISAHERFWYSRSQGFYSL